MLYISYFNKIKNSEQYKKDIVSIAAYNPRYMGHVESFPDFAPDRKKLVAFNKGEIDFDNYFESYWEKLEKINDIENVFKQLDGKILCCHCADVLSCHRYWLSNFHEEKFGILIPELGMDLKNHVEDFERKYNINTGE